MQKTRNKDNVGCQIELLVNQLLEMDGCTYVFGTFTKFQKET
jgi:hypothetical protein